MSHRIEMQTDEARELTVIRLIGRVSADGFVAALEKFYAEAGTRLLMWDLSEVALASVGGGELQKLLTRAKARAHLRPRGRTAIVAPRDLEFGVSRMYQIFAGLEQHTGIAHGVFRTPEEARAWLAEQD